MKVEFKRAAEEALAYVMLEDEELGLKIVSVLEMLENEPRPNIFSKDFNLRSEVPRFLNELNYDILRLVCSDFPKHRVFYFIDETTDTVFICDIVKRRRNTYDDIEAPHIKYTIEEYKKHFS